MALPWQIYILLNFHSEALESYQYNSAHLFSVIEGHSGPWWIYFVNLKILYGLVIQIILPLSLFLLYRKINKNSLKIAFIALPIFVYLFFSVAMTKMASFPFIVTLPVYLSIACMIDSLIMKSTKFKIPFWIHQIILFVVIASIGFFNFRFVEIQENHSLLGKDSKYINMLIDNKKVYSELAVLYPANTVIMNINGGHYLECMFYTGFPAYNFIPTKEQYFDLKKRGRTLLLFKRRNEILPDYITSDKSNSIITDNIQEVN